MPSSRTAGLCSSKHLALWGLKSFCLDGHHHSATSQQGTTLYCIARLRLLFFRDEEYCIVLYYHIAVTLYIIN